MLSLNSQTLHIVQEFLTIPKLFIFLGEILLGGEQGFLLQEASIFSPGILVYYIVHGVRWLNFSSNSLFRKGLYEDQHTVQIQMAYPAVTQTTIISL